MNIISAIFKFDLYIIISFLFKKNVWIHDESLNHLQDRLSCKWSNDISIILIYNVDTDCIHTLEMNNSAKLSFYFHYIHKCAIY